MFFGIGAADTEIRKKNFLKNIFLEEEEEEMKRKYLQIFPLSRPLVNNNFFRL